MLFFAVLACADPECDSGYVFNTDGLCVVDTRVPVDTDTQDTDTQDTEDTDTQDTDTGSSDTGLDAQEEVSFGHTLGVLVVDLARALWPW